MALQVYGYLHLPAFQLLVNESCVLLCDVDDCIHCANILNYDWCTLPYILANC